MPGSSAHPQRLSFRGGDHRLPTRGAIVSSKSCVRRVSLRDGDALPNPASVALHEKMGFRQVAHFREVGWKFNRRVDVGYWQLLLRAPRACPLSEEGMNGADAVPSISPLSGGRPRRTWPPGSHSRLIATPGHPPHRRACCRAGQIAQFLVRVKGSNVTLAIEDEVVGPTRAAFRVWCTLRASGSSRRSSSTMRWPHHAAGRLEAPIIIVARPRAAGVFLFAGSRFGGSGGVTTAAKIFIPLWLAAALVNMWIGVARAGYSVAEELPILLVIFAVPALAAAVAWWKSA